jgi:hypothetical protein
MKRVWCSAILIGLSICALPLHGACAPKAASPDGNSAVLRAIFMPAPVATRVAAQKAGPSGQFSEDYVWCSNWTVTGSASSYPNDTCCDRARTDASNRCWSASGRDCCQFGSCTFPSFSLTCTVVGTIQCATDGDSCSFDGECCGGHCLCGTCTGSCQPQSNSCWSDCECCSGSCDQGLHQCN